MTVRINDLPDDAAPTGTDRIPIDGASTRSSTLTNFAAALSPILADVPLSTLADQAAYTILANDFAGLAPPTAVDIATLATKASPAAGDYAILSDQAAGGALKKATVASLASAGSVASVNGQTGAVTERIIPGGRVTLTSGTSVTTSDVTGATSVYYTPGVHDQIPIYDGTNWVPTTFTELTLALDSNSGHTGYQQSGKNHDYFVINDAGTIRLGTGPTWDAGAVAGSDTARGTGAASTELQLLNGVQTNKNTITIRFGSGAGNTVSVTANKATYVGTGRMTADGVTEDSAAKRFTWNAYNQAERFMFVKEATNSWNYTTATMRQANGSTANQLDFIQGLGGSAVCANVSVTCFNAATTSIAVGIGLDSTSAVSAFCLNAQPSNVAGTFLLVTASWRGQPGLGRHRLVWLEFSGAAGTTTWYGGTTFSYVNSGIMGSVWG